MDAKRSREHFRAAIAAARPQERLQLQRMAQAALALAVVQERAAAAHERAVEVAVDAVQGWRHAEQVCGLLALASSRERLSMRRLTRTRELVRAP